MATGIPWYIKFIITGLYITLISYSTQNISPELGAVLYSLPLNLMLLLVFLWYDNENVSKIYDFTLLAGVYGIIGTIIFIVSMLYSISYFKININEKIKLKDLLKVVMIGLIPWSLYSVILYNHKKIFGK